jgi:hypothetical protein
LNADIMVYDLDGSHYVANFGEGGWLKWPAEHDGWRKRSKTTDPGNGAWELPPKNAALALMLSGVES